MKKEEKEVCFKQDIPLIEKFMVPQMYELLVKEGE